jgi:hypothetical protein
MAGGIRWALGSVLLAASVVVGVRKDQSRARWILAVALLTAPLFLYLKGAEQMAMWSQRRLIPLYLLWIVALVPVAGVLLQSVRPNVVGTDGRRRWVAVLGGVLGLWLVVAAAANAVRWPAPYWVRVEQGGDAVVKDLLERIGSRLTFADDYRLSVPLGVSGRTRVVGLTEQRGDWLGPVFGLWLAQVARGEEVYCLSTHSSPGLEQGVGLDTVDVFSFDLPIVRSKYALPAVIDTNRVRCALMRVRPLEPAGVMPVLDKVLDGSPLCLRGPWGRSHDRLKLPGGEPCRALWTRQGSGIVGPVPLVGGRVQVSLRATFAARSPTAEQRMVLTPPWLSGGVEFTVTNGWTEIEQTLSGPVSEWADGPTGVYRFSAVHPYAPSAEGIRGYESDLGVLLQRVRIQVLPH